MRLGHCDRQRGLGLRRRLRQRAAVDHMEKRVEEEQEARATGVDHTGLLEHRQLLGRGIEGVAGVIAGAVEHRDRALSPVAAPVAAALTTVRIVPSTGRITAPYAACWHRPRPS